MKIKIVLLLASILLLSFSCSTNTSDSSGSGDGGTLTPPGGDTTPTLQHIWTQYNTDGVVGTDKPSARYFLSMAYAGGSKIILFGGYNSGTYFNDTWEYDISTHKWAQYNTSGTKPSAREFHSMSYAGGSKLILFGGYNGSILGDTWEYDVSTHIWTQYNTSGVKPLARWYHSITYAGGSKIILFGGNNNSTLLGDTWEYNDTTHIWTQYNTSGVVGIDKPSSRYEHAMAYAGGSKLILFGGGNNSLGDTWEYDVTTHIWTQYNTGGVVGTDKPFGRYFHSMTYAGGSKIILFDGVFLTDTWEYDVSSHKWIQYNISGIAGIDKPSVRWVHSMAYAGNFKIILFGGDNSNVIFGDTWEYR